MMRWTAPRPGKKKLRGFLTTLSVSAAELMTKFPDHPASAMWWLLGCQKTSFAMVKTYMNRKKESTKWMFGNFKSIFCLFLSISSLKISNSFSFLWDFMIYCKRKAWIHQLQEQEYSLKRCFLMFWMCYKCINYWKVWQLNNIMAQNLNSYRKEDDFKWDFQKKKEREFTIAFYFFTSISTVFTMISQKLFDSSNNTK